MPKIYLPCIPSLPKDVSWILNEAKLHHLPVPLVIPMLLFTMRINEIRGMNFFNMEAKMRVCC